MWPATLRALRELTRLALATFLLTVALGASAAAASPHPSAVDVPAPSVATQQVVETVPGQTTRMAADSTRAADASLHQQERVNAPARVESADAQPAPVAAVPVEVASWRAAAGAGEPTRRGPPAA